MINYFEYFGLPVRLSLNFAELRKLYYQYSKKNHPDFYTLETEQKKEKILKLSTLNNEAYNILKDDNKRLRHFLEIKGVINENDKETLSPEFLMEMMEINEDLMEVQMGEANEEKLTSVKQTIKTLTDTLKSEINELANLDLDEANIARLKDCYFRKKYIKRLEENISKL